MQFILIGHDGPGGLEIRKTTRGAHIDYWIGAGGVLFAGPLLGADGYPFGSILVIEAADEAAARAKFAADPYAMAGLFENTSVSGFKLFIEKGVLIA
jgi:uncharacterized protein YciI